MPFFYKESFQSTQKCVDQHQYVPTRWLLHPEWSAHIPTCSQRRYSTLYLDISRFGTYKYTTWTRTTYFPRDSVSPYLIVFLGLKLNTRHNSMPKNAFWNYPAQVFGKQIILNPFCTNEAATYSAGVLIIHINCPAKAFVFLSTFKEYYCLTSFDSKRIKWRNP